MKLGIVVGLAAGLMAGCVAHAQAQPAQQGKPPETQQQQPAQSNPFPQDTTSVPVMTNGNAPVTPNVPVREAPAAAPQGDADPVRSPDDPVSGADSDAFGFSSSSSGLENVTPPPDTDIGPARGRKGRGAAAPPSEHQETAAEDEKVADYYLASKNWKAALSRYESAVVLDPENPEVYWGMGEAQRHLGKMAEAKAAYEKLVEYDPESRHGKDAKKILKSPEMANAPTASAKQP